VAVPDRDEPLPEPAARYQAAAATRAGTPFRSTRTHPPWRTHLAAALHPDTLLEQIPDSAHGPESRFQAREAVELAFIVGLQHVPPHQAAILLLRDVLSYSTAEVAAMFGTSQTAIKGCLQRARASLERHRCPRSAATSPAPGSRSGNSPDC
jgi:DNA-directed RNA polymerase specialized sigma24 family protein